MAKYRLRIAHELETIPQPVLMDNGDVVMRSQRLHLPGDQENDYLGEEKGTVVGDGTRYVVKWPTLEMIPLDDEARDMIAKEEERLRINQGTMNPVDDIDSFEEDFIPGSNRRRRPALPDGAPAARRA